MKDFDSDEEITTHVARPTFHMLSDSNSEDDIPLKSKTLGESFSRNSQQENIPTSYSEKSFSKSKKKSARKKKHDDLSIDGIADSLPRNIKENLSLMSVTVR